jgi:hypothetical protein
MAGSRSRGQFHRRLSIGDDFSPRAKGLVEQGTPSSPPRGSWRRASIPTVKGCDGWAAGPAPWRLYYIAGTDPTLSPRYPCLVPPYPRSTRRRLRRRPRKGLRVPGYGAIVYRLGSRKQKSAIVRPIKSLERKDHLIERPAKVSLH